MADNQDIQIRIKTAIDAADSITSIGDLKKSYRELQSLSLELGDKNTEAFNKVKNAAGQVKDKMNDMNQQIRSVSGSSIENLNGSLGLVKNSLNGLDFGQAAAGVKSFASQLSNTKASELTNDIKDLSKAFIDLGKQILTSIGDNLKNRWDSLKTSIGSFGSSVTKVFSGDLTGALESAKTGFKSLGDAIKVNPIFLIVSVIALIIANFDTLKKSGGLLGETFIAIGKIIGNVIEGFKMLTDAIGLTNFALEKKKALDAAISQNTLDQLTQELELRKAIQKIAGQSTTNTELEQIDAQLENIRKKIKIKRDEIKKDAINAEDLIAKTASNTDYQKLLSEEQKLANERILLYTQENKTVEDLKREAINKQRQNSIDAIKDEHTRELANIEEKKRLANEELDIKAKAYIADKNNADATAKKFEEETNRRQKELDQKSLENDKILIEKKKIENNEWDEYVATDQDNAEKKRRKLEENNLQYQAKQKEIYADQDRLLEAYSSKEAAEQLSRNAENNLTDINNTKKSINQKASTERYLAEKALNERIAQLGLETLKLGGDEITKLDKNQSDQRLRNQIGNWEQQMEYLYKHKDALFPLQNVGNKPQDKKEAADNRDAKFRAAVNDIIVTQREALDAQFNKEIELLDKKRVLQAEIDNTHAKTLDEIHTKDLAMLKANYISSIELVKGSIDEQEAIKLSNQAKELKYLEDKKNIELKYNQDIAAARIANEENVAATKRALANSNPEDLRAELDALNEEEEAKRQRLQQDRNNELLNAEKLGQDKVAIQKKYDALELENHKKTQKAKTDAVKKSISDGLQLAQYSANALSALNELVTQSENQRLKKGEKLSVETQRKQFKRAQALSAVSAGIATAVAIMQALSQLGPVAGGIAAGLIGVTGALQIAAILSKKFDPESDSVDSSAAAPGPPVDILSGESNNTAASNVSTPTLFGLGTVNPNNFPGNQPGGAQRVYVVESDITAVQKNMQRVEVANQLH